MGGSRSQGVGGSKGGRLLLSSPGVAALLADIFQIASFQLYRALRRSVGPLVGWFVGPSVGWSISPSVYRSAGLSGHWSVGQ